MKEETYGALKRIIEEIKEKRSFNCLIKDCVTNQMIMGNDIDLVEDFLKELKKEVEK